MLLISRRVLERAKLPINLKSKWPAPLKSSPFLISENYLLRQKEADLLNKTLVATAGAINNHVMSGRQRSDRFRGGGYGGRADYDNSYHSGNDLYNSGGYNYSDGMNPFSNLPNNISSDDVMNIMNVIASGSNMNPPPPPPMRMGCGELRAHHAGMFVELTGRLIKKRVTRFMELRDRGNCACQLVILEDRYPRIARRLINMPENTVLSVVGLVTKRPRNSCNQTMPTGEVEVEVQDILTIDFTSSAKKTGTKRSYSTMAQQQNSTAITSTEYKIAKSENLLKYFENRDITCNDLRRHDIGKNVTLVGWITPGKNKKFIQLKDGYGQTQIIIEDQTMQDTVTCAPENTVIQVSGKVLGRPKQNINMKYHTGEIEVMVNSVKILNPDDSYDGPIKARDKVKKFSINDIDEIDEGDPKNGETKNDVSDNLKSSDGVNIAKIADLNKFSCRTHTCGELTTDNIGEKVTVCGWLEFQRMGKFFVLRDAYGQIQVLIVDKTIRIGDEEGITLESIVKAEGTVVPRTAATINPKMKTGHIEIEAERIEVLNAAKKKLPFEVRRFNKAAERLRLQHRYIDLRFSDMQHNLRLRSEVIMRMREYLINYLGFVEVETPTLFRRTPGGAQEFVVPTRKAGHFYSLVQSPQQFKQMLMAGAIDRYFQVARCYRDEATRPDRQPEFTQLDIELSFTNRDDIIQLVEETLRYAWPKEYSKVKTPFKRITYDDAMENFGTDKPDIRFDLSLTNVTEIVEKNKKFVEKFKKVAAYALIVRGGYWDGAARKRYDAMSKEFSGSLFVRKFLNYQDVLDRLNNFLTADVASELISTHDIEEGDLLFLGIGEKVETQKQLGKVRVDYQNFLIENGEARKNYENKFVWIIDFPMFEMNTETENLESVHHPFTAPHPDDMEAFINSKSEDLVKIRSQAYDLVLNGQEIGGGSIRIHDRDMQHFVLEQILKIPHDHLSHLLNALESGCPPHGGIALGLDRLIAIICRALSIRDVIAFPKSLNGRDPLSNAPVPISEEEKSMYHLSIVKGNNNDEAQKDTDSDAEVLPSSPPTIGEEDKEFLIQK